MSARGGDHVVVIAEVVLEEAETVVTLKKEEILSSIDQTSGLSRINTNQPESTVAPLKVKSGIITRQKEP